MNKVEVKIDHNYHPQNIHKLEAWESGKSDDYKEYRKNWVNWPKNNIVGRVPIHLDIEATSNCNLLCTMCARTTMVENGNFWKVQEFDYIKYKEIIDEAAHKGVQSLKFNYLGEPLMNRNIFKMVSYAKEKGIIDTMFNTNATSLTKEKSKKIIECGLDKLFFSFDSPYKDEYEKIRVNANYLKTLKNIIQFHEIRGNNPKESYTPFTRVSMVKINENDKKFSDFKKLFEPIVDVVAAVDYMDHSMMNNNSEGKNRVENIISTDKSNSSSKFCCPQLWQRMFIHPDGVVTPCCVDVNRTMVMGNIYNNNIEEIWTSKKYNKLRETHRNGNIDSISTCRNCPLANH
ncbi:radical SAM/SPASM domain-containing protein [Marinospirillum sp.]|uniref:radical SAM/SPASM domain-containing protein n=1 Tax=Marinospirillum sp. TaxID=2183934 RepID=UPI00384EF190